MDLSPVIAWAMPIAGVLLAGLFGYSQAKPGVNAIWGFAFMLALVLGISFMLLQIGLHSACISASACVNRGDVNMSYWFQSLFAMPLYWLTSGIVWTFRQWE